MKKVIVETYPEQIDLVSKVEEELKKLGVYQKNGDYLYPKNGVLIIEFIEKND